MAVELDLKALHIVYRIPDILLDSIPGSATSNGRRHSTRPASDVRSCVRPAFADSNSVDTPDA